MATADSKKLSFFSDPRVFCLLLFIIQPLILDTNPAQSNIEDIVIHENMFPMNLKININIL